MVTPRDALILLVMLFLCRIIAERLRWRENVFEGGGVTICHLQRASCIARCTVYNASTWTGADTRRRLGWCSQKAGAKPAPVWELFRHKPVIYTACHQALLTGAQSNVNTVIWTRNGSCLARSEGKEKILPLHPLSGGSTHRFLSNPTSC